ncbi:hypothetical protein MW871_01340 [Flavobacterium sp. I-SCBP12n]|uniref:Uncharacterized protein n=2 Tax=Flavobacterium TaxID=237 RepID=A0A9X2BJR4_9FLAO|nr:MULTISPECIES: hypothetical protein [Flavobacterium]MBP4141215.1 hypothetical protein [Flavobacterium flabelliforme]MCK8140527.1 hypothetical protein [Flavobacterium pygoscelis]
MQQFYKFLKIIIPFSIVLFILQYYLIETFFKNISFYYSTWSIYVFHLVVTLLSYSFLLFVNKTFADKTGFAFMGFSLIKMMASIVFLIPLLQSDLKSQIPDVSAFFIPYFLFLFFETFFAVRLISKQ